MSGYRETPLHAEHTALGAALTPFAGWLMPLRYTSDTAEHVAVRTAAGLFDLSHMGEIEVRGPRAAAALDYALVGAMSAIAPGRARYTMICAPDGGIIDDLVVYRLEPERYWVVANASNAEAVLAELVDRCGRFGAEVEDLSARTALVAVQGPRAVDVLRAYLGADGAEPALALRYYAALQTRVEGADAVIARTGYTGEDGFEIYLPAEAAPALWRALVTAGRAHGLLPAGLACRDSLRLEAGMPLYGNELDRTTTPYDAGLGRVVRLDKDGDFVGRAALAARAEQPGESTLVGLRLSGRRAARHGYPVLDASGRTVGVVTSGAPSPTLGYPVALARVEPGALAGAEAGGLAGVEPAEIARVEPGARAAGLAVDVRGRVEPAEIVDLPFYRRPAEETR